MKRFYKTVSTAPEDDGFSIQLDGKPVRTPEHKILMAPTQKLADFVAMEWNAQVDVIDPETMPLTQILTTAIDCHEDSRALIEGEVLGYLDTDLLCYRAEEPPAVYDRQVQAWDPWLKWFEHASGNKLHTTAGLTALKQPQGAHDFAAKIVRHADLYHFMAIQMATAISGSLVLGMAFVDGAATPDQVFEAAQLEELYRNEIYNEEFYGKAPHQEKAHAGILRDLNALRVFLDSL
jgi:chaperone required for assembly of F1-ATPase